MNMDLYRLFHILWTKALGQPDYQKSEWKQLFDLLESNEKPREDLKKEILQKIRDL